MLTVVVVWGHRPRVRLGMMAMAILGMTDFEGVHGIAAVKPQVPADAQPELSNGAPAAGRTSYGYCEGMASLARATMTVERSAALTSTRPAWPSRAWNPRRPRWKLARAGELAHPRKVNGPANLTEDIGREFIQGHLRKIWDVVPTMDVIGS